MAGRLGIVAGEGGLPRRLIESCRAKGRDFFVLALKGAAEPETVRGVPHAWCRLGAAAEGLSLLRNNNVTELVLAGGVRRPSIVSLRPDWRAAKLFARVGLRAIGDDALLSAVVDEFEKEGFRVLGADELLEAEPLRKGPMG
ncbi:MAG: LpxI family protein, partial [Alphaproteobacteria bacterium]|nr:LpxI family protein [Alphaproteobacteria bacterium]